MTTIEQTEAFDASAYDLPIPIVDGHKADKLRVTLSGTIELDRTDPADLEWLESLRLGSELGLTVDCVVVGKPQTYSPGTDDKPDTTTVAATLKVHTIHR